MVTFGDKLDERTHWVVHARVRLTTPKLGDWISCTFGVQREGVSESQWRSQINDFLDYLGQRGWAVEITLA